MLIICFVTVSISCKKESINQRKFTSEMIDPNLDTLRFNQLQSIGSHNLALLTTNLFEKDVKKGLLTSIAIFIVINILDGVDNATHISGLLSGLVIGYAFVPSLKSFDNAVLLKRSTIRALTVILVIASFSICKTLSDDINEYEAEMEKLAQWNQWLLKFTICRKAHLMKKYYLK